MEYIDTLQNFSPLVMSLTLFGIVFLTGMGLFPNHNDLSLGLLVIFHEKTGLPVWAIPIIFFIALLASESFGFFIGRKFGHKLLKSNWMRKKFNEAKQVKIKSDINKNSLLVLLGVRLAPMFRPQMTILIGSLDFSVENFKKYHHKILALYILCVASFFYIGNRYILDSLENFKVVGFIIMSGLWLSLVFVIYKKINKT